MYRDDRKFPYQHALIIGMGISGRAAAAFLLKRGTNVYAVDHNQALLEKNEEIAKFRKEGMLLVNIKDPVDATPFDLVVVSPGIPPTNAYYAAAKAAGKEIIGDVELALRFLPRTTIGITGTNGKTTTTLLVTHVLNNCGKGAKSLGNIGVPLIAEVDVEIGQIAPIAVIELSSFQLETMRQPSIDVGVVLNITPDHLDRYQTMEDYAKAKLHLQHCMKASGVLWMEEESYQRYSHLSQGFKPKLYGYNPSLPLWTDLEAVFSGCDKQFLLPEALKGSRSHDIENIMAAYAICREMGISPSSFREAIETFRKPPHRIEFIRELRGVSYYDDSKGTNIDAVIRAVSLLKGGVILIAGGVDKGAAYTPWLEAFAGKVFSICAIGEAAKKIKKDLSGHIEVTLHDTLEAAIKHAAQMASPGQNILLSPGCSSFDMFRDYAHRGNEFQRIVNTLK